MKIRFGMHQDGALWSEKSASIGEITTGPLGFLGILEAQFGKSMPSVHPVRRIDEFMKRLELIDSDAAWFHRSFSVDPWSTARQLLQWRDELVAAGWKGQAIPGGSLRLKALADLEITQSPLTPDRADRLQNIIACLENKMPVHIASINLTEPLAMLPPVWQRVFTLLQNSKTNITHTPAPLPKKQNSNLSKIQLMMVGHREQGSLSPNDDSLILLKAQNEWEAAEHIALWLAADKNANSRVAILCGADTSILDSSLKRHGLAQLGRSSPSRWREIGQILPLTLANAWKPIDIYLLVELLSLTLSVFPKWVCKHLLGAISEEPGIKGRAWNNALEKIHEKQLKYSTEKQDPKAEEKVKTLVASIEALLTNDRFDPEQGIPEDKLKERCQWIIERLATQIDDVPMLAEVIAQARKIQEFSQGKGAISRTMLERALDTVIGPGNTLRGIQEEAGHWRVYDQPGELIAPCDTLIWWGFNAVDSPPLTYWSNCERTSLEASGIFLEKTKNIRAREVFAWRQALLCATSRFIAVHIAHIDGEETEHHPFWDSIRSTAAGSMGKNADDDVQQCLIFECAKFLNREDWAFAKRKFTLHEVTKVQSVQIDSCHKVFKSSVLPPKRLSYSQMSTLIACPFKWTLEYYAGLKAADSLSIPTGNQMIGTFCHRIIEELYANAAHLDVEDAYQKAGRLYDELIDSMASELLLEGRAAERHRTKAAVTQAVRQLVASINDLNLSVEKTEALLQGECNGIPFKGFADMQLSDSKGNRFVLDFKWSSSAKYKKQEFEEGAALQPAAYAHMVRAQEPSRRVYAGYFMLAQGKLLSDSPLLSDDAIKSPIDLDEVWRRGVAGVSAVLESFEDGTVVARGIAEEEKSRELGVTREKAMESIKAQNWEKGLLYQEPPCRYCDFNRLCGY